MSRADTFTPSYVDKRESFSDFMINMDMNPYTGNLARLIDEQSVKQALKILLLTKPGERFYRIDEGSRITSALFENVDMIEYDNIRSSVIESVANYEPRVNIQSVDFEISDDELTLKVFIKFTIINNDELQTLTLNLERA